MAAFLSAFFLSPISYAETIYTCKENKSATIGWQYGGILKKKGLEAEANNSPKEPVLISFVVTDKKGVLKGNAAQVDLKRISTNAFIEETPSGNLFMWTVVPGSQDIPTYIFQQKSYKLAGPLAVTVAYKCD